MSTPKRSIAVALAEFLRKQETTRWLTETAPDIGYGKGAAYVYCEDGRKLLLYVDHKGKIVVTGIIEREYRPIGDNDWSKAGADVMFTATRGEAVLVKEMWRRVVVPYTERFREAVTARRTQAQERDVRGRFERQLVEAMGLDVDDMRPAHLHRGMHSGSIETGMYRDGTNIGMYVPWPTPDGVFEGSVKFQIEVPAPIALLLAGYLGELLAE